MRKSPKLWDWNPRVLLCQFIRQSAYYQPPYEIRLLVNTVLVLFPDRLQNENFVLKDVIVYCTYFSSVPAINIWVFKLSWKVETIDGTLFWTKKILSVR